MRIIAALLIPFILLLGTGCTIKVDSQPTETTAPAQTSDASDVDEAFVKAIREADLGFTDTDEGLIAAGHGACDLIDLSGIDGAITGLIEQGFDGYAAGFLIGASITAYCPEYTDEAESFADLTSAA